MKDEELVERYRRGETLKVNAEAAGCGVPQIGNRIALLRKTHDLPYRRTPLSASHPRRKFAAVRRELVLNLHEAGAPAKDIAAKLNVDPQYVYQLLWRESPKDYDAELARLNAELASA